MAALLAAGTFAPLAGQAVHISSLPAAKVTTLAGQTLQLPQDLPAPVTVFILGFGRHSQDATTAWERPVRTQLAQPGKVGFYDVAMLAEVPSFVRPMVLRMIRHKVPDVLRPNFLPLDGNEDAWKQCAGYTPDQPEAAYVFVVDHAGYVHWRTHGAFSAAAFADLQKRVQTVSSLK